jgi:peptidyl-prolyl cis-trans isomerase C
VARARIGTNLRCSGAARPLKRLALAALVLASAAVQASVHAEPDAAAPEAARRARVVLRVGARKVTVGELEDHLAGIPPYQMSTFGASPAAIARAYVDQVLVRDLVLASGAEQRGLDRELPTSQLLSRALSSATLRKSGSPYPSAAAVPAEDVQRYYDENRARFDSPERVNLWRILCATREEAASVLESARRDPTMAKFNDLSREHSIDKATNLRGGNLGFVAPDGTSNEAGLKVDPAIVKAAQTVKNGELVPQPVPEGAAFAVVWRRGAVPASRRTVEEASAQIRAALYRERTEASEKKLIEDLRARNVKEVNAGLLAVIELRPFDAGLGLPRSPAGSSPPPRDRAPAPSATTAK